MLALLNFLPEHVLRQVFKRLDLTELVLVLGESRQITHFVVCWREVQHFKVMIQAVAHDGSALENTMCLRLGFFESDRTVLLLQVPWVHSRDPTAEVNDTRFWTHILVHEDVAIVVDD